MVLVLVWRACELAAQVVKIPAVVAARGAHGGRDFPCPDPAAQRLGIYADVGRCAVAADVVICHVAKGAIGAAGCRHLTSLVIAHCRPLPSVVVLW